MKKPIDRRHFIKQSALAGAGLATAGHLSTAFGRGAPNEKVVVAVMGVNSRGNALARTCAGLDGTEVAYICDVDSRAVDKTVADVAGLQARKPKGVTDFREALDDVNVDALVIATPDHWHAPATLIGLQAGKHVYVEKPLGHNPREGELLIEAQQKYNRVVQMGNQQRSAPTTIRAIQLIREGAIGRPYLARAWYANARGPIGYGKPAEVPEWLNYELWQGPAPRAPYRDNVIHYNWHWFWRWGTGEICNNGTHEIDVCRWALGVDFPMRVNSSGGRYHFDDDWEFYDTQVVAYDYEDEKTITWEGRSCNPFRIRGRGRGSSIHGTEGTIVIDRDGYEIYNLDNELVTELKEGGDEAAMDTRGGGEMTEAHITNFAEAVRNTAEQNSQLDDAHISTAMCHLGNIAQRMGRTLYLDQRHGHIIGDPTAMAMWSREYARGWEMIV